jgi:hypothetical protein
MRHEASLGGVQTNIPVIHPTKYAEILHHLIKVEKVSIRISFFDRPCMKISNLTLLLDFPHQIHTVNDVEISAWPLDLKQVPVLSQNNRIIRSIVMSH